MLCCALPSPDLEPANLQRSNRIATGVAYATHNITTTEAFFERGAALGIQTRRGDSKLLWEDTADFLVDAVIMALLLHPSPLIAAKGIN